MANRHFFNLDYLLDNLKENYVAFTKNYFYCRAVLLIIQQNSIIVQR